MMKNHFLPAIALSVFGALIMLGCSSSSTVAGGGTDVGNGKMVGTVIDKGNLKPVAGAQVLLFQADHDPGGNPQPFGGAYSIDTTDACGMYEFDSLMLGWYAVEIGKENSGTGVYACSLAVNNMPLVRIAPDTLKKHGMIVVEFDNFHPAVGGYLFIPGTSFYKNISAADSAARRIQIDSIPVGRLASIFYRNSRSDLYTIRGVSEIEMEENGHIEIEFESLDTLRYSSSFHDN